jgi:RibD C-terminal domain
MSKIVVSENITLDGAVQDPTGEEGVGGWFTEVSDRDREGFAETLIEQDLVDEWRLLLYPVVAGAGAGARLFGAEKVPLRLAGTRKVDDSLILLTYRGLNDH